MKFDPVAELYGRYPYPPAEPGTRAFKRVLEKRMREGSRIASILLETDPALAAGRILDAGCGTGLKLLGLAKALPEASITGWDVSSASLALARRLLKEKDLGNVSLARRDLCEMASADGAEEEPFDAAVCDGVLHHLKDPGAGLARLHASLRPGAPAWITLYGRYGRAEMGRVRKMLTILEPTFLRFEKRLEASRALLRLTGLSRRRHGRRFEDDAFLADAALNPRETWFDVVSARRFFREGGFALASWPDGDRLWEEFVRAGSGSGLDAQALAEGPSRMERYRLVELWKCPGMLGFFVRRGPADGPEPGLGTLNAT